MANDKLELWRRRDERLRRALNYEPVDRIPFLLSGPAWGAYSQGVPLADFCTDPEVVVNVTLDALDSLGDIEGINTMNCGLLPCHLTNQWFARVRVPGRELPPNELWQVQEEEIMTVDDYDLLIDKGWDAFAAHLYPKVHQPDLLERHNAWLAANFASTPPRYHNRGYATMVCCVTEIPFEALCGARTMTRFFMDCYRMPGKVKAALDAALPFWIDLAINVTKACGIMGCWIGGWRAASAIVNRRLWDTLVFPYYLEMITRLQAAGILCVLHFDQNWDRDIGRFLEFPKGCVLSLDGLTDIRRAKRILGEHMAFLGDVPPALLAAGAPGDVYGYVRDLVRDLGPTGLVMNSGCDIPYNAPRANVEAMVAATREFGTYT